MIQPLNGNVKISKFSENKVLLFLILIVLLLLTLILEDKIVTPKLIEFTNGNRTVLVKTFETTVDAFLRNQNITLTKGDLLTNSLSEQLVNGSKIKLIKIKEEVTEEEEEIPYKQVTHISNALSSGTQVVIAEGVNGRKKNFYKIIFHNDIQKSREFIESKITENPCDRIILKSGKSAGDSKENKGHLEFSITILSGKGLNEQLFNQNTVPASSSFITGTAFVKKDILIDNSLIIIEGYGTFIVKTESSEIPAKFIPASNEKMNLLINPGFEKIFTKTNAEKVKINMI